MENKKYELIVTSEQLKLIMDCVEDCDRFYCGQLEMHNTLVLDPPEVYGYPEKFENLRLDLRELERKYFGNFSLGYNTTVRGGNMYQMWREIKHFLTVEAGHSNVYSGSTLPSGNQGEIKIRKL